MPITQDLNYLNARGGLVSEENFDLLAAPLGRIYYNYDDVERMVLDQCALEGFDPDEDELLCWTYAVISAAITVKLAKIPPRRPRAREGRT